MKNTTLILVLVALALAFLPGASTGLSAQKLVKSEPASDALNVPLDVGAIRFHFDCDMLTNSYTVWRPKQGTFPTPAGDNSRPWKNARTFEIKIARLAPDTTYAVQLNAPERKGFQRASDRNPLPITVIVFKTGPASAPTDQTLGGGENPPPDQTIGGEPEKKPSPPVTPEEKRTAMRVPIRTDQSRTAPAGGTGPRPGWRFQVRRTSLVDLVAQQAGQSHPIKFLAQVHFIEEIQKARGPSVQEVTREVSECLLKVKTPQNEQVQEIRPCPKGASYRVTFQNGRSMVTDARTGAAADETVAEAMGEPLAPALWPIGPLTQGQRWTYREQDLTNRLAFLDAQGGELALTVEKIVNDPDTGLPTAQIRGQLRTKIQLDELLMDYTGNVSIDLPLGVDVPQMLHLKGKLSLRGTEQDQYGNPVAYSISGDGEYYQVAAPAKRVVEEARGGAQPAASTSALTSTDASFGYQKSNPVCVGEGPAAAHAYLQSLRDAKGRRLSCRRAGSMGYGGGGNITDLYVLTDQDGNEYKIFVDHYHADKKPASVPAPTGLTKAQP